MVQVYAEPLCRRHYASWIGEALVLRLGLFLVAIVVSLVVAFATGGFWPKIKPSLDQPRVYYTNDALLLFEGANVGEELIWSTSPAINAEFPSNLAAASVQVAEHDYNFDGKPDAITFEASMSAPFAIHSIKALLQFKYSFEKNVRLQMYSLAYLSASSPRPGGVLATDGQLELQQRSPITDRKFNGVYNIPLLDSTASSFITSVQAATSLDVANIMATYLDRNYTTVYGNVQEVWKASSGTEFKLSMHIRIPANQVIWYRPQLIEMLKFGWIQFLATYVVLWHIFSWVQRFVFSNGLVCTRVVSDTQPKLQRF